MANPTTIELHALGAETDDGTSDAIDIGLHRSAVALALTITGLTGTDVLAQVQTSPDGSTGWRTVSRFTSETDDDGAVGNPGAKGRYKLWCLDLERYVRVVWTVNTACTFSVAGFAYTVYCTRQDIEDALPDDVFEQIECSHPGFVERAGIKGASHVEAKIGTAHDLPLSEWQPVLAHANAALAAYMVLTKHRMQGGGNELLVSEARAEADVWLEKIQTAEIKLPNTSPTPVEQVQHVSGDAEDPEAEIPSFAQDFQRGAF